jgi:hypothetical protein
MQIEDRDGKVNQSVRDLQAGARKATSANPRIVPADQTLSDRDQSAADADQTKAMRHARG